MRQLKLKVGSTSTSSGTATRTRVYRKRKPKTLRKIVLGPCCFANCQDEHWRDGCLACSSCPSWHAEHICGGSEHYKRKLAEFKARLATQGLKLVGFETGTVDQPDKHVAIVEEL